MLMPSETRIFVCSSPADMRRSFYGLCGLARDLLKLDPLDGSLFVFLNKNRSMVKILWYEGDGFAIWTKRLNQGTFCASFKTDSISTPITCTELSLLLKNIGKSSIKIR
jgi:transposase